MKHLCAWCGETIRIGRGRSHDGADCNYGMCRSCVSERLTPAAEPLGRREVARARRMHRCGRSLQHIGQVLGVPQLLVQSALAAA